MNRCQKIKSINQINIFIITLKINLFSPWYSWKIDELALNNNHSLNIWLVYMYVCWLIDLIFWCLKQYFSYIMVTSFSGGRSRQATGKLYHLRIRVQCTLFCNLQSRARKQLVNFITCAASRVHLFVIYKAGRELL
jgi:hypothetical protein